jgi:long-subunit fatty acid transport protein
MEAETDDPAGTPAWEDVNALHAGAEYQFRPAIALRAGYRQLSTPYVVQGSGIVEEQGRGSIYSAGAGWARGEISVDFAYEYHRLLFTDRWASNVNYQLTTGHTALLTIGYRL